VADAYQLWQLAGLVPEEVFTLDPKETNIHLTQWGWLVNPPPPPFPTSYPQFRFHKDIFALPDRSTISSQGMSVPRIFDALYPIP